MNTDTELFDLVDEIIDNQERTANVLSDLLQRMTRMETRLVILVNALGHADKIFPVSKPN